MRTGCWRKCAKLDYIMRENRMKRKISWKWIALIIVLLALLLFAYVGISYLKWVHDMENAPYASEWATEEYHRARKPDDWLRIVADPQFQLGDVYDMIYNDDQKQPVTSYGTFPNMNGSTVAIPMAQEFAWQFIDMPDDALKLFYTFSRTHRAYENLIYRSSDWVSFPPWGEEYPEMEHDRPVDIIIATHPSEDELQLAADEGVELVYKPVCYDAFVFITHRDNTVDNLSIQQVRDIYSGKVANWSEVGGQDKPIKAYQRNANSGSQTGMEQLVMQGMPMFKPKTEKQQIIEGMGMLIDAVEDYENNGNSIGYSYKFFLDNQYQSDDVKILSIDGVQPTPENIRNGKYPYYTYYYGVIRSEDAANTGGLFLEWMLSEEGQRCIKQAGYIPMDEY